MPYTNYPAPEYDFVQLYSYAQNSDTCNKGGPPSGEWSFDLVFENSDIMPAAPGFVSGAALWLKTNIVSVGLIHLPLPTFTAQYAESPPPASPSAPAASPPPG